MVNLRIAFVHGYTFLYNYKNYNSRDVQLKPSLIRTFVAIEEGGLSLVHNCTVSCIIIRKYVNISKKFCLHLRNFSSFTYFERMGIYTFHLQNIINTLTRKHTIEST